MQPKFKVRKGDEIIVISGKDKGKKGEILKVFPAQQRLIVKGVNIVRRHVKPSIQYPDGGIVKKEATIHVSNVQHLDPSSGKPTREGWKTLREGVKIRYANKLCKFLGWKKLLLTWVWGKRYKIIKNCKQLLLSLN